jgi:multiple sugar transport system ATP-binding protein
MAALSLKNVTKAFGTVEVIRGVDLDVADGEFCVFVGPSGCGKSTLLRMIAGLEMPTSGFIAIGGKDVTWMAPAERGISMVFQSYALYPHMTVAENIGFGLKMAGVPRAEIRARTAKAAELLQLAQLLDRRPSQLSGGQRQRVAIGRAIVRAPEVFLFDEPLSNLDAALRVQMRIEISKLHQNLKATMVYVTHDQVEAMTMADKIVVLNAGRIEQVGSPLELYHKPRNLFVATFIGSPKMNCLTGAAMPAGDGRIAVTLKGGRVVTLDLAHANRNPAVVTPGPVTLGIRPEHLGIVAEATSNSIPARIMLTEHLGGETMLYAVPDGADPILVKAGGLAPQKIGDTVHVALDARTCHLFDPAGKALVNGSLL